MAAASSSCCCPPRILAVAASISSCDGRTTPLSTCVSRVDLPERRICCWGASFSSSSCFTLDAAFLASIRRASLCSLTAADFSVACRIWRFVALTRIVWRMFARQPLAYCSSWASPERTSSCSLATAPISCISSTYSSSVQVFCTAPSVYTSVIQSAENRWRSIFSKARWRFSRAFVFSAFGSTASEAMLPTSSSDV